jgi:hypothetical protein
MPITQDQLNTLKAANHAKSMAWEAATFTDGDCVVSHGHLVSRSGSTWIDDTGRSYETLSRWIRHKLERRSYDVKNGSFLRRGTLYHPVGLLPPYTERMNFNEFNPASHVSITFRGDVVAGAIEAKAEPTGKVATKTQEERVAYLEERLLVFAAAVAEVAAHAALLKDRVVALEQRFGAE